MTSFYFFVSLAFIALIVYIHQLLMLKKVRRKGVYPIKGKVTNEDIKRLALSGNRLLAIRAYRELHKCGLKKAKKKVNNIVNLP
ncbi:MAG: hypothetical protein GY874_22090 [Desulfobacteraceae bacterium]|nr:hypothetical protein [Desulfobacteraceae bacterium]